MFDSFNFYILNIMIFQKISLKKYAWSFCMGLLPSMLQVVYTVTCAYTSEQCTYMLILSYVYTMYIPCTYTLIHFQKYIDMSVHIQKCIMIIIYYWHDTVTVHNVVEVILKK